MMTSDANQPGTHSRFRAPSGRRADAVPEVYLVIVRDTWIAQVIAMTLHTRLVRDGHPVLPMIPPLRGRDFTGPVYRRAADQWCAAHVPAATRPILVALSEDGLRKDLELLGLPAFVGIPPERHGAADPAPTRPDAAPILMIPAATVGDFVQGIVDRAASSATAGAARQPVPLRRSPGPREATDRSAGSRPRPKLTVVTATASGMAGTLLLGSLQSPALGAAELPSIPGSATHTTALVFNAPGRAAPSSEPGATGQPVIHATLTSDVSSSSGGASSSGGGSSSSGGGSSSSGGGSSSAGGPSSSSGGGSTSSGGSSDSSGGGASSSGGGSSSSGGGSSSSDNGASSSGDDSSISAGGSSSASGGASSSGDDSSPSAGGSSSSSGGTSSGGAVTDPTGDGTTTLGAENDEAAGAQQAGGEITDGAQQAIGQVEQSGDGPTPDPTGDGTTTQAEAEDQTTGAQQAGSQITDGAQQVIGQIEQSGDAPTPDAAGDGVTTEAGAAEQATGAQQSGVMPRYVGLSVGAEGAAGPFGANFEGSVLVPIPGAGATDGVIDTASAGVSGVGGTPAASGGGLGGSIGPAFVFSNAKQASDLTGWSPVVSVNPIIGVHLQISSDGTYVLSLGKAGEGVSLQGSNTFHAAPVTDDAARVRQALGQIEQSGTGAVPDATGDGATTQEAGGR